MRYAEKTSVSVEKSKAEIERTLQRYGADQFIHGWDSDRAIVGFRMEGKQVKFVLEMPNRTADEFLYTATGRERSIDASMKEWEQACRQRWRALAIVIKAKLEAVESGITIFEEEFMAHLVLPNGQTAGEYMIPQIAQAYSEGKMPNLLPHLE